MSTKAVKARVKKVKEMEFKNFPYLSLLASYNVFGHFSPAVWRDKEGRDKRGYHIRIYKNLGQKSVWEYFDMDETGLVVASPRGLASIFNGKVRVLGLDRACDEYKEKVINQR